ncbi:hypothetical protein [Bradyrhizobium sp. CCBAU 25338]|uniref:hypothetical protein n=1 Tax=Bradyrhizobium sp. CCBAU 25338 TaxID=1641877 RepID=UPI0023031D20|nr:hypothetical protein [Bradyrhizobium sp. CCBAU 25338]MDA9533150.1 hypothetical protein [Bradyrhizobium sp. CCBAU 25338]
MSQGVRLLITAVLLMLNVKYVTAAEPTKIKGFYIGMTRAEVLSLKPADVEFFEEGPERYTGSMDLNFTAKYSGAPQNIAVFIHRKDHVDSFVLRQTYFDRALTLKPREFINEILAHYPFKGVACGAQQSGNRCTGKTPEGDFVQLDWDTQLGAAIRVTKAPETPAEPKPSFD